MATNNNQGASEFKRAKITSKQSMALYDALPKEYRDVLKESVMNLTCTDP